MLSVGDEGHGKGAKYLIYSNFRPETLKKIYFCTRSGEVSSKPKKEFLSNMIIWFLMGWCCWLSVWSLDELATDDWEVKEEKEGFSGQGEVAPAQETFQQVAFFLFSSQSITVQWDKLVGGWNWWIGDYLTGGMSWINDYKYICCQWLNSYRHRNSKIFKHCFCKNINIR